MPGYLFTDYVDHFYEVKANTKGPVRAIAKLSLNSLYGFFGRSMDTLKTMIVGSHEVEDLTKVLNIKSIIKINDQKSLLLLDNKALRMFGHSGIVNLAARGPVS